MKVISDIGELLQTLALNQAPIDSGFHIFRLEDFDVNKSKAKEAYFSDFFEIAIVIKDDGHFSLGEESYHDIDQTICFLSPGQLASYKREKGIAKGYSIHFKSSFLIPMKHSFEVITEFNYFKLHTLPIFKLNETNLNELLNKFHEIYEEFELNDKQTIPIIRSYLIALLYKIKRLLPDQKETVGMTRPMEIASKFEDLVCQNADKHRQISFYASRLNISPAHLSECVKKVTGKPAKQVILDFQLLKAKSLLKQSNLSIKEIALRLGYEDVTNFSKFIKKHLGVTPKAFRNNP
ncbi:MAG: helix-turn-helix domain-containing protein [Carboxylicivirga sp.]|jgi:AraC-like DNA-binding protein|nr:helix-turn-helix domain-containing protein [Carboxylicivirga sp.]